MQITPLKLNGTYIIDLEAHQDQRGYFARTYDENVFSEHGLVTSWVQENQSSSVQKGIIRGLHFQKPPHAETKLIRVIRGAVLDVFVDLRGSSPTYGEWDAVELTGDELRLLYIPKGFAHGFCTLSEQTLVQYKVDSDYAPHAEGGIRWNDENLGIHWPTDDPILSERDRSLPSTTEWKTPF